MRKFGLIGFPLGHSFSKKYFSDKFRNESIYNCSYENYELENIDLFSELISRDNEICGLNVTIPYKSEVIKYLDVTDTVAREVGAVNVLKISLRNNSRIINGFNTDVFGFRESLLKNLKGITIKRAIILGTGGSSKAVSYVLKNLGISIIHVSRRSEGRIISYRELSDKIISESQLIVNSTPLGMYPLIENKPEINYNSLTSDHILFDLVYNPALTSFLKEGKERGCKLIGGLEMLTLQAEKSWEIWNDGSI